MCENIPLLNLIKAKRASIGGVRKIYHLKVSVLKRHCRSVWCAQRGLARGPNVPTLDPILPGFLLRSKGPEAGSRACGVVHTQQLRPVRAPGAERRGRRRAQMGKLHAFEVEPVGELRPGLKQQIAQVLCAEVLEVFVDGKL